MKALSTCALFCFALLSPLVLAQQSQPRDNSLAASVAGTTWVGTDSSGRNYEYYFIPDGALHYKSPTGFWTNGTWKQDGNVIYFEMNKKYSERKGVIWGTHMEGKGWNKKGETWTWVAEKK